MLIKGQALFVNNSFTVIHALLFRESQLFPPSVDPRGIPGDQTEKETQTGNDRTDGLIRITTYSLWTSLEDVIDWRENKVSRDWRH